MSQAKLILSQSPPLWVPLRFFVTAPLFAIAAAITTLLYDPMLLSSRWSAPVLASTHLLVIGFMAMVMTGALIQVVSVLLGGTIQDIRRKSVLVHASLTLGTVALAVGFVSANTWFMRGAVVLLATSFCLFAWIISSGIASRTARSDAGIGIGLAMLSLMITILLGLWLASGYGWDGIQLERRLTDIHLTWGLLGWVGILCMTVAYEVVPMFQLTPVYPEQLTRWLAPVHILALLLWSGWILMPESVLPLLGGTVMAATITIFASVTLWLQQRRKKKQPDTVVWFWRCGMLNIIVAACLWLIAQISGDILLQPGWQMFIGTVVILGFAISLINGMLYKIVPFLIWLHLSISVTELKLSRRLVPNIKKMIPDTRVRPQFWMHLLSLFLFLAAAYRPDWFLTLAALVFTTSNILLLRNIYLALQLYSRTGAEIMQAGEQG